MNTAAPPTMPVMQLAPPGNSARRFPLLRRIVAGANTALAVAGAIGFAAVAVLTTATVVLRSFDVHLTWSLDVQVVLLLWSTFLALGYLQSSGSQIPVDFLRNRLSPGIARMRRILMDLLGLAFAVVVTIYATLAVWDGIQAGARTNGLVPLPLWIVEAALPVGFALLAVTLLADLFLVLATGEPLETTESDGGSVFD